MFLGELNFKPLVLNFIVFYNPDNDIFIVIFIDDCLFIGFNINKINAIKKKIAKEYIIEDRGSVAYFLEV